jgi:hypothetical protein
MRKLAAFLVLFGACGAAVNGAVDGYNGASAGNCSSSSDCDSDYACSVPQGKDRGQCVRTVK